MNKAEGSLSRARGLFLLCAAGATLGAAGSMAVFKVLFPILDPERPPGFTTINLMSLYMDNFGVIALLSVSICLALAIRGWRRDGAATRRSVAVCLEVAAWAIIIALILRITSVIGHREIWSSQIRTVARFIELGALGAASACIIAGVGWRKLLLSPRWSWLLATLISTGPSMVFNAVGAGDGEHTSFWFRICLYPLCFATCWAIWEEEREATPGAAHGALLGIIIYLPTSMFLTYENFLGGAMLGDLKAAYILTLMAVGLNAAGLLAPAMIRLMRGEGSRLLVLNLAVGLLLLTLATFPTIVLPWEYESRGFINRLAIQNTQAMVGMLLILMTRVTQLLGRWDPRGGAGRWANLTWLLFSAGYLLTGLYRDWVWSYEVWVQKEQWVTTVHLRQSLTAAWIPLLFVVLLVAITPSVVRAVRTFFIAGSVPARS